MTPQETSAYRRGQLSACWGIIKLVAIAAAFAALFMLVGDELGRLASRVHTLEIQVDGLKRREADGAPAKKGEALLEQGKAMEPGPARDDAPVPYIRKSDLGLPEAGKP